MGLMILIRMDFLKIFLWFVFSGHQYREFLVFIGCFHGPLTLESCLGTLIGLEKSNFRFLNNFTFVLVQLLVDQDLFEVFSGFGLEIRIHGQFVDGIGLEGSKHILRKKLVLGFSFNFLGFFEGVQVSGQRLLQILGLVEFLVRCF